MGSTWTLSGEAQALYSQINKGSFIRAAQNDLISVIYNVTASSHDAAGCGETDHSAQSQTVTRINIMAKKAVKSKASKPAPKKAAAKKGAKKK
jgi:hypothetical protein